MRGQYFAILNSSLRCLNRGIAVQNACVFQCNQTRSVLLCERFPAFSFHTSSAYSKDDSVDKEPVAKTEDVSKVETAPVKSAAEENEKSKEQVIPETSTPETLVKENDATENSKTLEVMKTTAKQVKKKRNQKKSKKQKTPETSAPETLVKENVATENSKMLEMMLNTLQVKKNEKSKEQVIPETSAPETLVKENDATENIKTLEMKLTTAKQVKKKRNKKKSEKQKTSETLTPETLVKKVSQEMYPEAVKEQKKVEYDLLTQLLAVDGKVENAHETTTKLLFENTQLPERKQLIQTASSQNRLQIFRITNETRKATQEMKRPQDKSLWTATDWFNSMQDEVEQLAYDSPYPANAYQEQIMWTEEGKLWTFPINNEQGVDDEEVETPFHKHVFLESHLNDWCPRTGAIRDFMTSLVTALSMNPHLTVREKHEHLDWFRAYFAEKSKMMQQLGLIEQQTAAASS